MRIPVLVVMAVLVSVILQGGRACASSASGLSILQSPAPLVLVQAYPYGQAYSYGQQYQPPAQQYPQAQPYKPQPYQQQRQQSYQRPRSSNGPSQAELNARIMLLRQSMGFGGIFAPTIKGFMDSGSTKGCGQYTNYAACQASKAGDGWAADRLQNNQSNGAERDWYDR